VGPRSSSGSSSCGCLFLAYSGATAAQLQRVCQAVSGLRSGLRLGENLGFVWVAWAVGNAFILVGSLLASASPPEMVSDTLTAFWTLSSCCCPSLLSGRWGGSG
jgi:hypothetical protein